MKIGEQHRNRMWKSLVEFRNATSLHAAAAGAALTSQSSSLSSATASNVVTPVNANGFNPGYYEVTRYTFKHTISLDGSKPNGKPDNNHQYC